MMKRILSLLLALALAAPAVPARAAEPASPAYDGYLISLAQPADEALVEATGCETVGDNLYYAETVRDAGAIAALGEVEYWTTNDILATQDSFAGYETPFWNLRSVGAAAGWAHLDGAGRRDRLGDGVTVAVVDSGVMADHPDLANAHILDCVDLSPEANRVDDYHGTFVAGLLAAEVNNGLGVDGVVPHVTVLPVCITWGGGKTDVKTAVEGINKAVELGADVITFSIGGTRDNEALRQACEAAADRGVILVTCAGNYTAGRAKSAENYMYPAAYDCVVTVSACRQEEAGVVFDSEYSYFNNGVTVSAPGTGIVSLFLDGNTATRTGTSFAAPIVTAMAVMAKQADRTIDTAGFTDLLRASSTDLGEPGFDPCYGYGYVNIPAFLNALDGAAKPVTPEPAQDDAPDFIDVPAGSWFYDSVRRVTAQGIMKGTGDGTFSPNGSTSRAMVVTILWRLEGEPRAEAPLPFRDVPAQAWYAEAVRWASASHVAEGYSADRFAPDDAVTREQLAAILYRYAGGPDAPAGALDRFADQDRIAPWARTAMAWAVDRGLLNGKADNLLDPGSTAGRAQAAAIIIRFCGNGDG